MGQVTPEQIQGILINPFYALQVAPQLVETHIPSMSDEEWITGNISLIQEMGQGNGWSYWLMYCKGTHHMNS